VLALAATIELRVGGSGSYQWPSKDLPQQVRRKQIQDLIQRAVSHFLWLLLMVWLIEAEWTCLNRLRGVRVPDDADADVQQAMIVAMVLLVIIPIIQGPITQYLAWYDKAWKSKRAPKSLPDHHRTVADERVED
jgi:uncharacterized membrane protein